MALFHPRVIEKHIKHVEAISDTHTDILSAWAEHLSNGIYDSETQNDDVFIQRILVDVLGYVRTGNGESWTVAKNEPVGKGNVDAALGHFVNGESKIIAPFELKGAKTKDLDAIMAGRNKSPVQQAWEYAMDAKGAQWVLVSNYREIRLYAVGYGRKDYESFDLSKLTDPQEYARFILLLSSNNLLSGNTQGFLKESEQVDKDITNKLYADYKDLRVRLIKTIGDDNPEKEPLDVIRFTQTILDRILFVAFAEDKGLLPENTLKQAYETQNDFNPQPIWKNFKGLFKAINKGNSKLSIPAYNGGLFADDPELDNLNISDELCEGFKKIGDYDFDSDVSVNILGHIFEQSISDLEELKAHAENVEEINKKQSKRKKDGIFYTPPYVTRYIVEQAVGGWLNDRKLEFGFNKLPELKDEDYDSIKVIERGKRKGQITYNKKIEKHIQTWEAYKEVLSNIKVLDPACGSGAFLNEVFDYLKAEGEAVNNQLSEFKGGQTTVFGWDTHILANNIYGVDLNSESVEITKLSLWLKTANRREKLSYLEDNIKVGNSLVSAHEIAGECAFNWKKGFSEIILQGGFDVIVGNPPYIDSEEMAKSQPQIRDHIASLYESAKGNWDIYIPFFELSFRLLKPKTGYLSFITPDKWISKDFGDQFRVLYARFIQNILELGRDVFEEAKVDSIVTTFKNSNSPSIKTYRYDGLREEFLNDVKLEKLNSPFKLDPLFSKHFSLINRIEENSNSILLYFIECENACATSDAYELKKILADRPYEDSGSNYYKVCNTGTLDKYVFKWGNKPMKYLKDSYLNPVVLKTDFEGNFGNTYVSRAKSPKIVIKGLTLMDCALDLEGEYIPGKSTLVLKSDDKEKLKGVAAFLNSRLVIFYIKQKYASSSYNGGINFTKDMINNLPLSREIIFDDFSQYTEEAIKLRLMIEKHSAKFLSLLITEFNLEKISRKLENWFELEFSEFLKEIEKLIKPEKLSLSQKSEWMEHFEKEKSKALELKNKINQIDREIDQMVYELYELTPEEIELIENAN